MEDGGWKMEEEEEEDGRWGWKMGIGYRRPYRSG
jgi:hypothetical protein